MRFHCGLASQKDATKMETIRMFHC